MKTALGNLLRHLAELADNGECGVDAETFAKVAELQRQDHNRINLLTDAVTLIMEAQNKELGIGATKPKGKIVSLHPDNDSK